MESQAPKGSPSPFMSLILVLILPLLSLGLLGRWKAPPPFPRAVPWPSGGDGLYARIRAFYRGWPSGLPNLSEGYRKVRCLRLCPTH